MMTSGAPADPPVRVGVPFADLVAPVFAVVGILAALRQRDVTGVGQHVDVSMLGVLTSLVAAEPFDLLEACGLPQRTGRMVPRLTPFGVYESADGYLAICAPTEQFARGVFAAMGRPDLRIRPSLRDARRARREHGRDECLHRGFHARPADRRARTAARAAMACPRRPFARRPMRCATRACSRAVKHMPIEHPEFGRVADVIGPGRTDPVSRAPRRSRSGPHPPSVRTTPSSTESGSATAQPISTGCARPGSSEAAHEPDCHRRTDRRLRGTLPAARPRCRTGPRCRGHLVAVGSGRDHSRSGFAGGRCSRQRRTDTGCRYRARAGPVSGSSAPARRGRLDGATRARGCDRPAADVRSRLQVFPLFARARAPQCRHAPAPGPVVRSAAFRECRGAGV